MYCEKCGIEAKPNDKFCKNCGAELKQMYEKYEGTIKNHIGWAIAGVLFCVPLGVAALIASTEVDRYIKKGDIEKAEQSSKRAKLFGILGLVIGIPATILYLGLQIYLEFQR